MTLRSLMRLCPVRRNTRFLAGFISLELEQTTNIRKGNHDRRAMMRNTEMLTGKVNDLLEALFRHSPNACALLLRKYSYCMRQLPILACGFSFLFRPSFVFMRWSSLSISSHDGGFYFLERSSWTLIRKTHPLFYCFRF